MPEVTELKYESLVGRQKAGVLMVALGPEVAGKIFAHLGDDEVEQLALEISDLKVIPKQVRASVLEEFYELALAQEYISLGGMKYARDLLKSSMGGGKAQELLRRVQCALERRDFQLLRKVDPAQLANFIQNEHPQTIALVLSHLDARQSADILSRMNEDIQGDVGYRIATMDAVSPAMVREVERILSSTTENLSTRDESGIGGVQAIVDILLESDRTTEKRIIEGIDTEDAQIAGEIRNSMFVFEDLMLLDNRSVQRVMKDIETSDLTLALKAASPELREHIFKNMSTRAAQTLADELEVMGPVKLKNVEESQQKIVAVVRKLEEEGEIAGAARGSGGEEFVY
ncbi:MAG: flagellar motor switch protein FliG [Gemmatimonadetes bacterium]|nr:flagellar motor switch protein FliG [Gemmatimonadota bacterium]